MPNITTFIDRLGPARVSSELAAIYLISADHNITISNKRPCSNMEWWRIKVVTYCVVFILLSNGYSVLSCDNRTAARIGQYPILLICMCVLVSCGQANSVSRL